ncbi:unnamed protein product [Arctogadus glacialis]
MLPPYRLGKTAFRSILEPSSTSGFLITGTHWPDWIQVGQAHFHCIDLSSETNRLLWCHYQPSPPPPAIPAQYQGA